MKIVKTKINAIVLLTVIIIGFSTQRPLFSNSSNIKSNPLKREINEENILNDETDQSKQEEQFWNTILSLDADGWKYNEWKEFLLFYFSEIYNINSAELDELILNNEINNYNFRLMTYFIWGVNNGTYTPNEIYNLRDQMKHQSVSVPTIVTREETDYRVEFRVQYSIKSDLINQYRVERLSIWFEEGIYGSGVLIYEEDDLNQVDPDLLDPDNAQPFYSPSSTEYHTVFTSTIENFVIHVEIEYSHWTGFIYWGSYTWPQHKHIYPDDDDTTPPKYISAQVKLDYEEEYLDVDEKIYIFKGVVPENLGDIDVKVTFEDQDDPRGIPLDYRKSGIGKIYYNVDFYDIKGQSSRGAFWGEANVVTEDYYGFGFFTIPRNGPNGWESRLYGGIFEGVIYYDLDYIEISVIAQDADNDREPGGPSTDGDGEWSTFSSIKVAQVVDKFIIDGFDIKLDYAADKLRPELKYDQYTGENVKFRIKCVNGLDKPVYLDEIHYAIKKRGDISSEWIFITQETFFGLDTLEIRSKGIYGNWSEFFMTNELKQFFIDTGYYDVLIVADFILEQIIYNISYISSFRVIEPEKPRIKYHFGNWITESLKDIENFLMFFKDDSTGSENQINCKIEIINKARLNIKLNSAIKFDYSFIEGKTPTKFSIDKTSLDFGIIPSLSSVYKDFTLLINDATVFLEIPILESIYNVMDLFVDPWTFMNDLSELIQYFSLGLRGKEVGAFITRGAGAIISIIALILDIIETFQDLDIYNLFKIEIIDDIYCSFVNDSGNIVFNDYYDLIHSGPFIPNLITTLSAGQLEDMGTWFLYHLITIGVDIAAIGANFIPPPFGQIISIACFIGGLVLKILKDQVKEDCNDPPEPAVNYTQYVIKDYINVTIPRVLEDFPQYSSIIYNLMQNIENFKVERQAQLEIRERLIAAKNDDNSEWILNHLNDLSESESLENLFKNNYLNSLQQLNALLIDELTKYDITNNDVLDLEKEVEMTGIPEEMREIILDLGGNEDYIKEFEDHIKNITEYNIIDSSDEKEDSYLNYYKKLNMLIDTTKQAMDAVTQNLNSYITKEYVEISVNLGEIPQNLTESEIDKLKALNNTIGEKLKQNDWESVNKLCGDMISEIYNLMKKTFNSNESTLILYYNYTLALKQEAISRIREGVLIISSPDITQVLRLEPKTTKITPIYLQLINTSIPSLIELDVKDINGTYAFLSETGESIECIYLEPETIYTIYLNYSLKIPDHYGIQYLQLNFTEPISHKSQSRIIVIDLVKDDDTSRPIIEIAYIDGDSTDSSSGKWDVYAYDRESGINFDSIEVYIDGILSGTSFGQYTVPNALGEHSIEVMVFNSDPTDPEQGVGIKYETIIDDDDSLPTIEYFYSGDGTDGNPGSIIIEASDESGLSVDPSGSYPIPNSLGTHNFMFTAVDNDSDRPDDTLTSSVSISITISDDDTTTPEGVINYIGEGLDNNPGYFEWNVWDVDSGLSEIEVRITYSSTDGSEDFEISFPGFSTGKWDLPPNLGFYTIFIFARDNDDDRTLLVDSLTTEVSTDQEIIDDDVDPPELSNLVIIPEVFEISISFDAIDLSGIGEMIIIVNREIVEPTSFIKQENTYTFIITNNWLFKKGYSEIEVQVFDADNDRINDALMSSISGNFKNVLFEMYEYVDWQLEELKTYIEENLDCRFSRCLIWKLSKAQAHLLEAFTLVENSNITCGLFHDFIAKIYVRFSEIKTEILNRKNRIDDDTAGYIIDILHNIRNHIVILMGASTGSEQAYDIGYIEVDLLNLSDFIEDEIPCCTGKYLSRKVYWTSKMLEIALFKIAMGKDIECLLKCAQWKLERVVWKINWYLNKGRISEDLANYLIEEITRINEAIEQVIIG